ncbi:type II toxin-antitoxin system RelE/ParE family toxin [Pusillimonas sp. NJUB218]|nr:type II toxin-antitoxin system RelE/ParE family toxin [Pusillimonas sp. NJUB218]
MNNERVFKTRHFARWMRKTELLDDMLCNAVEYIGPRRRPRRNLS